jgi:hypothetical protein
MQPRKQIVESPAEQPTAASAAPPSMAGAAVAAAGGERPVLPPDIEELFWAYRGTTPSGHRLLYQPSLLGRARLHFADSKSRVDVWQNVLLLATASEVSADDPWAESEVLDVEEPDLESVPAEGAKFASLPAALAKSKNYAAWATALKNHLYRTQMLSLFRSVALKATSQPGESERDFRLRLSHAAREERDAAVDALREKYTKKLSALEEKIRQAQKRVEREKAQASQSTFQAAVSFGSSLLGALVGKKTISAANVGRAATSARAAGRAMQQRGDIALAAEDVEKYQQMYDDLQAKLQTEIDDLQAAGAPDAIPLEPFELRPKKSEIAVDRVALVWMPWWSGGGSLTRAF